MTLLALTSASWLLAAAIGAGGDQAACDAIRAANYRWPVKR